MCWFTDCVTLLSARCKYKMQLHVSALYADHHSHLSSLDNLMMAYIQGRNL